jgi:hypothetical protein
MKNTLIIIGDVTLFDDHRLASEITLLKIELKRKYVIIPPCFLGQENYTKENNL